MADGAPPVFPDAAAVIEAARPRSPQAHLAGRLALSAEDARLYRLSEAEADLLEAALADGGTDMRAVLGRFGIEPVTVAPATVAGAVRALTLTVSQSCNLACSYCYAAGGSFGGPEGRMSWPVAAEAIDRMISAIPPGGTASLAFMGGEPMVARDLIRRATEHARRRAAARAVRLGFALTTNATLLTPEDAAFFARHRFTVTVSLDGGREVNDRLRPARGGRGSYDRAIDRLAPLFEHRDRIALSARITATPENLDLRDAMDRLGAVGFRSVGVSPLLASPDGHGVLGPQDMGRLLQAMIDCGEDWLAAQIAGRDHPFANLATALGELHRGTARSHSCGAGVSYLAVDAEGAYSACHRFVRDPLGRMGDLASGVDEPARRRWVEERAVERQTPCATCWARRLCGGGCHHEVLHAGRPACDYVRGWLHYAIGAYERMLDEAPGWFDAHG